LSQRYDKLKLVGHQSILPERLGQPPIAACDQPPRIAARRSEEGGYHRAAFLALGRSSRELCFSALLRSRSL
jgi:hypothetical protein